MLSAVLANDIVCLAMAPIVIASCAGRRLDPLPFLLALAAAANVGSAATLIGNPQNMLIGQVLRLSFTGYLLDARPARRLGLVVVWAVIRCSFAGRWQRRRRWSRWPAGPSTAGRRGRACCRRRAHRGVRRRAVAA